MKAPPGDLRSGPGSGLMLATRPPLVPPPGEFGDRLRREAASSSDRSLPKPRTEPKPALTERVQPEMAMVQCNHCQSRFTQGIMQCLVCRSPLIYDQVLRPGETVYDATAEASVQSQNSRALLQPTHAVFDRDSIRHEIIHVRSDASRSNKNYFRPANHLVKWCTSAEYRRKAADHGQTALDPRYRSHTWVGEPSSALAPEPALNSGFGPRYEMNAEQWTWAFAKIADRGVNPSAIRAHFLRGRS